MNDVSLALDMPAQPTETTCGPTCLYAVYRHLADTITPDQVIAETATLPEGGTLAVHLATHALERGYRVRLYSFNLQLLDPTWFTEDGPRPDLRGLLAEQATLRADDKLRHASTAYARFLELGGDLQMAELGHDMLRSFLRRGVPLLVGVSATFLYRHARELPDGKSDPLHGEPQGHFVVVAGARGTEVLVRDPWHPESDDGSGKEYWVPMRRLVHAVLLGVLTYDGNLMAIERPTEKALS
ncbi:MAG: hypothetical protein RIF41_23560 [Polyangiaceae bacterium]